LFFAGVVVYAEIDWVGTPLGIITLAIGTLWLWL
jgi:hypothetical protein